MNDQQPRGIAIDDADLPEWARPRFTPAQRTLSRGLLWMLLLYQWRGRHPSRKAVAQRLYVHTVGRDRKEWDPTFAELAADLDLSPRTVEPAVEDLEADGWILVRRLYRRNVYRLSWPVEDVLAAPEPEVPLCGEPTSKGGRCGKKAGRGTDTPGVGPCQQHRPEPGPGPADRSGPQPLRSTSPEGEHPSTATVADFDRNGCSSRPQPLQLHTATVAVPYVGAFSYEEVRGASPLLAVGERTDRNARERATPPARETKDHSFAARSLTAGIPRYGHAPAWVRTQLARLTAAALDAGFGRDAIDAYARMVIAERTYGEHEHIPELRAALARLGRDAAQGDACPQHGTPECFRCIPDRPWTAQDQADLEAALDRLGAPDDLAKETS